MTVKEVNRIESIFKDIGLTGAAAEATRKYLETIQKDGDLSDRDIESMAGTFYDGFLTAKGIDPFKNSR